MTLCGDVSRLDCAKKNPLEDGWIFEGMRFVKQSLLGPLVKIPVAAAFVAIFGFFGDQGVTGQQQG